MLRYYVYCAVLTILLAAPAWADQSPGQGVVLSAPEVIEPEATTPEVDAPEDEESFLEPRNKNLPQIGIAFLIFMLVTYWKRPRKGKHTKCARCGHRESKFVRTEIILEPSPRYEGLRQDVYECAHCGYDYRMSHPIPRPR